MWEGWLLLQVPVDGTIENHENLAYIYNDDIDGNDDDDDDGGGGDGGDGCDGGGGGGCGEDGDEDDGDCVHVSPHGTPL